MSVPNAIRRRVTERAGDRCEYCGLSQQGQEAMFLVDHIHPVSLGGTGALGNLALACVSCSLRKGARASVADPENGVLVPIFNPRRDSWNLHFRWRAGEAIGLTETGRATVAALMMNRPIAVCIRQEEAIRGRHPPPHHV